MFLNLKKYLEEFENNNALSIVGPFYDKYYNFSEPVVFVDRGVEFKNESSGFSVGDGDSTNKNLNELLNPEKNFSDLSYVLVNIPNNFKEINLLGFLGGRRDHELINFAECHQFLKSKTQTKVIFENKVLALSRGDWSLDIKGLFSVFLFEKAEISLNGKCKYPSNKLKELSSHGLSNVGNGEIQFKSSSPFFIFFN